MEARKRRRAPRGQRLDRDTLVASIRQASELAADAAAAVLDWADREPRLDIRYTHTRGRIETGARPFLKLAATGWPGKIEVRLVQDLADIGVQLKPKRTRPRAPLEPLADDTRRQQFLTLMDRVLDTLPTSP